MKLVLVHGINQQAKSSAFIQAQWLTALRKSTAMDAGWPAASVTSIATPFYGDRLFALAETRQNLAAVAQGADEAPDDFAEFAATALREMAMKAGAREEDIDADAEAAAVAQGAGVHKRWLKAAARGIEAISPFKGEIALRVLGQAFAYLKRPHITEEVDDLVRPALDTEEPMLVVAHSLGTIVTYKLLREFAQAGNPKQIPLYVTLGSPLGIDVVRRAFPLPRTRPKDVTRWLNGADPEDFVALRPVLDKSTFGTGIDNIADIENGYDDPHAIEGYLSDKRIAAAIAGALS